MPREFASEPDRRDDAPKWFRFEGPRSGLFIGLICLSVSGLSSLISFAGSAHKMIVSPKLQPAKQNGGIRDPGEVEKSRSLQNAERIQTVLGAIATSLTVLASAVCIGASMYSPENPTIKYCRTGAILCPLFGFLSTGCCVLALFL